MGAHQASDPHAMPLADSIAEVMAMIDEDAHEETVVDRCKPLCNAPRDGKVEELSALFDAVAF